MIKRSVLALFIVLLFSSNQVGAQDVNIISGNQSNQPVQTAVPDTFPLLDLEETELDKIPDLRAQFEKLNSSYSSPAAPSENLLRFLKKDEIELSPEAQYWVNWVRDHHQPVGNLTGYYNRQSAVHPDPVQGRTYPGRPAIV